MIERENAIVFLGAWIDACSLWRLYMPHLNLPGSSFYCFAQKPAYELIAGNDVVVVQRCCTKPQFDFLHTMQALELKIVYDLDDDVWDIPDFNPAHGVLTKYRNGFNSCIRMVDVVSVSTQTLAKTVKKNVRQMVNMRTGKEIPIIVAENRIDLRLFAEPVQREKVIVGWAGSSSHVGDLLLVQDVLKECAVDYPQAEFQFRGLEPPSELRKLLNVTHMPWMPVAEYGARMPRWGWTIALAPLVEHPFNDAKSGIKMLEAAYCGIPCLASWCRPYDEFTSKDPELRWLLCAGESSWRKKLRELLNDPARREELGKRNQRVAVDYYSFANRHEGWEQVFQAVKE